MEITLDSNCSWAIAYINRDFIGRVDKDISKYKEFRGVKAFIPTVKILRKQFKGKDIFEEVPLLFNYGFFQIPNDKLQTEFLQRMKAQILAIHAWVKDTKTVIHSRPSLITGNEPLLRTDVIPVALATPGEINQLINSAKKFGIYDKEDVNTLAPGTFITLKGYPFEGMTARVKKVGKNNKVVKVELFLEGIIKEVAVSFDNVFYTAYHGTFDETEFREKSIEEVKAKYKNYDGGSN